MAKTKFYTVTKGRQTGVFTSWADCQAQTNGYSGAQFKSYPTRELAEQALRDAENTTDTPHNENPSTSSQDYIRDSISVDAACSGNPGAVEYQCVHTETGELLFSSPIYPVGTNNIGEFLAVVDALSYLNEKGDTITPIYTDSVSALAWLRNKRVKTKLPINQDTKPLFNAIDDAIDWLYNNTYHNQVLKWDTELWGESKADFGRK